MLKQFIGKTYWITLGLLALVFLASVLVFQSQLSIILLALIALGTLILSWHKLEIGLAIAFAELMANSHGHLVAVNIGGFDLSLRMIIFGAVMLAWLGLFVAQKISFNVKDRRLWPFYALGVAVLIGFIVGLMENDKSLVFQDGNAYLYAAYILPIVSIEWTAIRQRLLLQVLAASVTWVIFLSLGLLYLYTHLSEVILVDVYTFIRDTRTGEITRFEGGFYRVFMQSQFWVYVMMYLLATYFWIRGIRKKDWVFPFVGFAATFSIVTISMSRSFWVGAFAAVLIFLVLVIVYSKPSWKKLGGAIGMTAFGKFAALLILIAVVFFPIPRQGDLIGLGGLTSRTGIDDVAVTSRWKLLDPMISTIKMNPVIGYGFGKEIEFKTDDPRILEQDPSGVQKTFAFEWGWLELMVKMGIFGIIAFAYLFFTSFKGLQPLLSDKRTWLGVGLISGLVMLYFTHIFSPYLNHPIGLGYLLFLVPFFQNRSRVATQKVTVTDLLRQQKTATNPKAAALTRK